MTLRRPSSSLVLLLLAAGLVACGANLRTKVLRTNLVALNVARDELFTLNKAREAQIVEQATSKDEGKAALTKWRARVDEFVTALHAAYQAIYTAAILDDAKSSGDAAAAVTQALSLYKTLKELKK